MAPDAASTDPASPETPPPSGAWSIDAVQLEPGSEATNDPAVLLLPWALGRAGWLLGLTALMVPALALLAAGLPSAEGWQRFSALVLAQAPLPCSAWCWPIWPCCSIRRIGSCGGA
jgi:hypothetical protein